MSDGPRGYCKGIYAGCCVAGCMSSCTPCDRIAAGTSTYLKELERARSGRRIISDKQRRGRRRERRMMS